MHPVSPAHRTTSCLFALMLLAMALSIAAPATADPADKEITMLAETTLQTTTAIPPIDAAVPEHFETASFGLG